MSTSHSDEFLVVRIHTSQGVFSELWDPKIPLSLGQPLRWVLELRKSAAQLRLTDTMTAARDDRSVGEGSLLAEFPLNSSARIAIHRERAVTVTPMVAEEEFGITEQKSRFKKSLTRSIALLVGAFVILPFIRPSTRELVARAPVQVVDLSKLAQSSAKAKSGGGSAVASRLKALVAGSASRWLAKSPTSTLSGKWADRYTASFGNMAQANVLGISAIGKNGYSGSLGSVTAGGGSGRNWVDLDSLAATVEEGLSKDEVGQIIHKHMKEIRYCYETAMIRSPDLEGKLIVQFTIGNQGMVRSSGVRSSTIPDQRLDDCVLSRLAGWKFPQPKGGIEVAVTYPFIFKSLGK